MRKTPIIYLLFVLVGLSLPSWSEELRWWKGNTHTHTWWSDGDNPPEIVAAWYKDHGYNFLVLSDHNILARGEKWYNITEKKKEEILQIYRQSFGENWVRTRNEENQILAQLRTLKEFRSRYEVENQFILMEGEEISNSFNDSPIHMNVLNPKETISPQHGDSKKNVIENTLETVLKQKQETGNPIIIHINHPNFGWALTVNDIIDH